MRDTVQIRTIGSQSDIALIKLRGFLDTVSAYHLQQQGDELIQNGIYKYIFNLEQLEYISSAGIETFHDLAQKVRTHKGEIIFTNVPEKIHKLFEIIGTTTTFFCIKKTVQEAIKEFKAL
jgi:anti-sigma B factor antagonist